MSRTCRPRLRWRTSSITVGSALLGQLRRRLEDRAADHHADDLLGRCLDRADGLDVAPVAHDRDPVGDLLELLEPVGDVDDPVAPLPEVTGDPEQLVDLGVGERSGRLVHDQDVRVVGQGLRDLDHLLLGHGKARDASARIQVDVEVLEQLRGPAVERLLVEERARARGSRPMNTFWATVRCPIRFSSWWMMLIPRSRAARGDGDVLLLPADPDDARVAAVDAGQDLHQGGLAGPVLADEARAPRRHAARTARSRAPVRPESSFRCRPSRPGVHPRRASPSGKGRSRMRFAWGA